MVYLRQSETNLLKRIIEIKPVVVVFMLLQQRVYYMLYIQEML